MLNTKLCSCWKNYSYWGIGTLNRAEVSICTLRWKKAFLKKLVVCNFFVSSRFISNQYWTAEVNLFKGLLRQATTICIISWDFFMFYQIILSPQVKRCAIITYKNSIYELPCQNQYSVRHSRPNSAHWNDSVYRTPIDRASKMGLNDGSGHSRRPTTPELWRFPHNQLCCLLEKINTEIKEDFEQFFVTKQVFLASEKYKKLVLGTMAIQIFNKS